jgi:hypothetical protein
MRSDVDPNAGNDFCTTPLWEGASNGQEVAVRLLLQSHPADQPIASLLRISEEAPSRNPGKGLRQQGGTIKCDLFCPVFVLQTPISVRIFTRRLLLLFDENGISA